MASAALKGVGKRIVFTGGSGKAGRHVIPELLKRGHQVGRPVLLLNIRFLESFSFAKPE